MTMKKAILIPEEQYSMMIDNYDKAIEELNQIKAQIQELSRKHIDLKLMDPDEALQDQFVLEDIFEMYQSYDGCIKEQSEPAKKLLIWFDRNRDITPEDIKERLTEALAGNEMQWFANGFRCAMASWRTC